MRVRDTDFRYILLDKKSYKTYENISIYDVSCKTFMGPKALRIWCLLKVASQWYNITAEEFCQHRKKKILPVTVEESCHRLLKNRASDC